MAKIDKKAHAIAQRADLLHALEHMPTPQAEAEMRQRHAAGLPAVAAVQQADSRMSMVIGHG